MLPLVTEFSVGIVTSIIVGLTVWLWGRFQRSKTLRRKSHFFGIHLGENCFIVMNHHPRSPNMMSHEDIETLVEATRIVYEIGGEVTLAPYDKLSDAGSVTEFCIGGPESNKRTKVHLDNFLKGVQMAPYSNTPDSLMIMTKSENFRYEKHEEEYAILARFWSTPNTLPVFLICGQTGRANRGAVHYLAQNYDSSLRRKFDTDSFCLIVKIKSPLTYGYKVVSLVKDITESAFTEMSKEIIS